MKLLTKLFNRIRGIKPANPVPEAPTLEELEAPNVKLVLLMLDTYPPEFEGWHGNDATGLGTLTLGDKVIKFSTGIEFMYNDVSVRFHTYMGDRYVLGVSWWRGDNPRLYAYLLRRLNEHFKLVIAREFAAAQASALDMREQMTREISAESEHIARCTNTPPPDPWNHPENVVPADDTPAYKAARKAHRVLRGGRYE